MSEIKSTLDLIMERTRHLSLKPEELARVEREESVKKARGRLSLFLQGERDKRATLREIQSLPDAHAEAVREACRADLLAALSPGVDNRRVLDAVEGLLGADAAAEWERACGEARSVAADGAERQRAEARERFRAQLASEGISGNAVVPADARNPFLREVEASMAHRFQERVQEVLAGS